MRQFYALIAAKYAVIYLNNRRTLCAKLLVGVSGHSPESLRRVRSDLARSRIDLVRYLSGILPCSVLAKCCKFAASLQ